jgi:hypothetical protein
VIYKLKNTIKNIKDQMPAHGYLPKKLVVDLMFL